MLFFYRTVNTFKASSTPFSFIYFFFCHFFSSSSFHFSIFFVLFFLRISYCMYCLLYLKYRRICECPSIFYRYFHASCSSEDENCISGPLLQSRSTHYYCVKTSKAKINQYICSFIPLPGRLWRRLIMSIFPPAYDLQLFGCHVLRSLSHQIWVTLSYCYYYSAEQDLFPYIFLVLRLSP